MLQFLKNSKLHLEGAVQVQTTTSVLSNISWIFLFYMQTDSNFFMDFCFIGKGNLHVALTKMPLNYNKP